jgi:hypothetical protein
MKIDRKSTLTAALLRELLHYDPETGIFTRKVITTNRVKVGDVAGSPNQKGYINIMVCGRLHPAHRLAWFYVHGVWPKGQIDHINGIRDDNRIANLREATNSQNKQNMRTARADNESGLLGVRWHKRDRRWHARIMVDGAPKHIGSFGTSEEAQAAYMAAKRRLHEFGEIAKEAGSSMSAS